MKLHRKTILGLATAVVVTSIGGAFAYHNLYSETPTGPLAKLSHEDSTPLNPNGAELVVRAFEIEQGANCATHSFTGTLQPRYQSLVGFRVAGKIASRHVELGERIKKGQVLFKLNPEDAELQLRVAEADQVSAQSLLIQTAAEEKRLAQLRTSGSVSISDYDLAVAGRDVAKARFDAANRRLELAKNQRTYCDLTADSDGLVTAIQAESGQVVNVGQPVLQIMQSDELEAVVNLPEGMVSVVKGLEATAAFWSRPDIRLQAQLRELSPVADPQSRTYDARFRLLESATELAIGMTVSIQLDDPRQEGISVPLTAISSRENKPVVWRIETNGGVTPMSVDVIQYRTDFAIVRGELNAGDRIVSAGVQRVDEHAKVRVWEAKQ